MARIKDLTPPTPTTPYERFLTAVVDVTGERSAVYKADEWGYVNTPMTFRPDPTLSVEWVSGGISGGNCWDSGGHYSREADTPEELASLDTVLELCCPQITFLQHRALTRELVKSTSRSQHEYYGNHTDHQGKEISLLALYNYLAEKGWLPAEYMPAVETK